MKIGFLTCPGTHPGSATRRDDAFEHDLQVDALRPELARLGHELIEIDWRASPASFADFALALVGTPWDYQDDEPAFLAALDGIEQAGCQLCNPTTVVRWNSRKTYLHELEQRGAKLIPTIWVDNPTADDITQAFATLGCPKIVAKRQVGAGAEGQSIHQRGAVDPAWQMDRSAMLQPFLLSVLEEGEYSFLFIDSELSHALLKRPSGGDYRVQSLYGGTELAIKPSSHDLAAAQAIMAALPFPTPLYARIDMVRGQDGGLLLMEAELIEPYLYPLQGPKLGPMLAAAIARRLA